MAKKGTKTSTPATTNNSGKKKNAVQKKTKKSVKIFKPKKVKGIVKGAASILANAGINKLMSLGFEERVKKEDFLKNGVFDEKAYLAKLEQTKTLKGATNIGLYLTGFANAVPKKWVSAEYLEISRLEKGAAVFIGKVDEKRAEKNPKAKPLAPFFQGIEDGDQEVEALIENAELIERALAEGEAEAYIEDYAYIDEDESQKETSTNIEYEVDEDDMEDMEGMDESYPGIEEEN